jgi:hypothetical protein
MLRVITQSDGVIMKSDGAAHNLVKIGALAA